MASRRVRDQVVAAEIVAVVLVLAATSGAPAGWLLGVPTALALVALGFGRWRRRWLFQWVGVWLRYAARPRALPPGAGAEDLLTLVAPGAAIAGVELGGRGDGVIEGEARPCAALGLGGGAGLPGGPP